MDEQEGRVLTWDDVEGEVERVADFLKRLPPKIRPNAGNRLIGEIALWAGDNHYESLGILAEATALYREIAQKVEAEEIVLTKEQWARVVECSAHDENAPIEGSWRAYLDRLTGDVFLAQHGDPQPEGVTDEQWERLIDGTEESPRFVELPAAYGDTHDAWEWRRAFAESLDDGEQKNALLHALGGPGAFRYFRDEADRLGLMNDWLAFGAGAQEEAQKQVLDEWADRHGITQGATIPE